MSFSGYTAPPDGVVTVMDGALRSILLPAIGPAVAQLPSTSQTTRLSVLAFAVSMPAPTDVTSENDASAGLARPVPESLAVQARATLVACHAPSGAAQAMVGAVLSSQTSPTPSRSASA